MTDIGPTKISTHWIWQPSLGARCLPQHSPLVHNAVQPCMTRSPMQSSQYGLVPPSRAYHTTTVIDNKLYVFGGTDGKQRRLDDLCILDTEVVPPHAFWTHKMGPG